MWVLMKFIYVVFMMLGTFLALTSSSWFVVWLGLEMNMMGFIPLVGVNSKMMSEAVFKYFLVQALGSLVLFMVGLLGGIGWGYWMFMYDLMFSGGVIVFLMALSMGASPFHYWFLSVSEGLDWVSLTILMTWQKLAPLGLIVVSGWSMLSVMIVGVLSVIVGGMGGMNQLVSSKLMAYSSVSHLGWMSFLFMISSYFGLMYYMLYVLVSFSVIYYFFGTNYAYVGQMCSYQSHDYLVVGGFCISLFSLGGLPPFLGFYPKWLGIEVMMGCGYFWIMVFYVLIGLMTLYFYLRMGYVWFLGGGAGWMWNLFGEKRYYFGTAMGLMSVGMLPVLMYLVWWDFKLSETVNFQS